MRDARPCCCGPKLLRKALRVADRLRTFGPRITVAVKGDALDAEPTAAVFKRVGSIARTGVRQIAEAASAGLASSGRVKAGAAKF